MWILKVQEGESGIRCLNLPSCVSVMCFLSSFRREEEGGIHHPGSWRSWPHDRSDAHEEHCQSRQECPADSPGENPLGCCVLMNQSAPSCSDSFHPTTPPPIFIFYCGATRLSSRAPTGKRIILRLFLLTSFWASSPAMYSLLHPLMQLHVVCNSISQLLCSVIFRTFLKEFWEILYLLLQRHVKCECSGYLLLSLWAVKAERLILLFFLFCFLRLASCFESVKGYHHQEQRCLSVYKL